MRQAARSPLLWCHVRSLSLRGWQACEPWIRSTEWLCRRRINLHLYFLFIAPFAAAIGARDIAPTGSNCLPTLRGQIARDPLCLCELTSTPRHHHGFSLAWGPLGEPAAAVRSPGPRAEYVGCFIVPLLA